MMSGGYRLPVRCEECNYFEVNCICEDEMESPMHEAAKEIVEEKRRIATVLCEWMGWEKKSEPLTGHYWSHEGDVEWAMWSATSGPCNDLNVMNKIELRMKDKCATREPFNDMLSQYTYMLLFATHANFVASGAIAPAHVRAKVAYETILNIRQTK